MVLTARMPGKMRVYWTKKVLEWTDSSRKVREIVIYLDDKCSLEGRDPNRSDIAWDAGGVYDLVWAEGPVIGKILYIGYSSKSKFNGKSYIKKVASFAG